MLRIAAAILFCLMPAASFSSTTIVYPALAGVESVDVRVVHRNLGGHDWLGLSPSGPRAEDSANCRRSAARLRDSGRSVFTSQTRFNRRSQFSEVSTELCCHRG